MLGQGGWLFDLFTMTIPVALPDASKSMETNFIAKRDFHPYKPVYFPQTWMP